MSGDWVGLKPKADGIDPDKMLSEDIAEGLTLGPDSEEEAKEKFPNLPGAPDLSYLKREGGVKFRVFDKPSSPLYIGFPDGRLLRDVDIGFTKEDRERIEQGYICIRCLEPQSAANADDHLEGCIGVAHYGERYMRDGFHLIDVAAEFDENEVHVGPERPLQSYLDAQEERRLKRAFAEKKNGG
jgi:hypothetical protein